MNDWKEIWVHGYRTALEAWIEAKKVDDGEGNRELPHEIFVVGPVYPQVEDGTDDNGNPKYRRKGGSPKCLWLFALHGDAQTLLDEIKVLNGPYAIIEGETIDDIKEFYPEYALGQGIPHIAKIQENL